MRRLVVVLAVLILVASTSTSAFAFGGRRAARKADRPERPRQARKLQRQAQRTGYPTINTNSQQMPVESTGPTFGTMETSLQKVAPNFEPMEWGFESTEWSE